MNSPNYVINPIEYYKRAFVGELIRVMGPSGGDLPMNAFLPSFPGHWPHIDRAFDETLSKRLFLFCYFFSSLRVLPIGHKYEDFGPLTLRPPDICTILNPYYDAYPPEYLLLIATLYISDEDEGSAREEFRTKTGEFYSLARFFSYAYCDFLINDYPRLTGHLVQFEDQKAACIAVLTNISKYLEEVEKEMNPFGVYSRSAHFRSEQRPRPKFSLCKQWIDYFRQLIRVMTWVCEASNSSSELDSNISLELSSWPDYDRISATEKPSILLLNSLISNKEFRHFDDL